MPRDKRVIVDPTVFSSRLRVLNTRCVPRLGSLWECKTRNTRYHLLEQSRDFRLRRASRCSGRDTVSPPGFAKNYFLLKVAIPSGLEREVRIHPRHTGAVGACGSEKGGGRWR